MAFVYFTAVDPTNVGEANPQLANYMEPPVAAAAVQVDYTPVQEATQDDETDGYDANAYAAATAAVGLRNAAAVQQPIQAEVVPEPVSAHTTPLEERIQLLRREHSGSGWYGVTLEKKGSVTRPYLAQIRRNGRQVKLGRFETGEEAARAYAEAMTPEDLEKLRTPGRHVRHAPVTRPRCPQCSGNNVKTLGGGSKGKYRYTCHTCNTNWQQIPPHRLAAESGETGDVDINSRLQIRKRPADAPYKVKQATSKSRTTAPLVVAPAPDPA